MHKAVTDLIKIAHDLEKSVLPTPALCSWLAAGLQAFLDCQARTIDEALGLIAPRGGMSWREEEKVRARNSALRELAATLPAERRIQELRTTLERYAATAWRFDSGREAMPEHYRGTQREILWRAFKSGARLPLCERQLRNIVGGEPSRTRQEPTAAGVVPGAPSAEHA